MLGMLRATRTFKCHGEQLNPCKQIKQFQLKSLHLLVHGGEIWELTGFFSGQDTTFGHLNQQPQTGTWFTLQIRKGGPPSIREELSNISGCAIFGPVSRYSGSNLGRSLKTHKQEKNRWHESESGDLSSATDGQPDAADHGRVRGRPSGLLARRHPSGRDSSNSCWSAFCSTESPQNQPSRTADDKVNRNMVGRKKRLAFRVWLSGARRHERK